MLATPAMLVSTVVALASPAGQHTPPASAPAAAPSKPLAIGSPAPALVVATWIHGGPIERAEPGKVTVIDFWSPSCGPTMAEIPHLARQARERGKEGVVVVGITRPERGVTLELVRDQVARKGDRMPYAVGWDEGATHAAYLDAAGRSLPTCFVVDRAGTIAWIGHPNLLDVVLPKVLDGSWKGQADAEELARAEAEFRTILMNARQSGAEAPGIIAGFVTRHPDLRDAFATRLLAAYVTIERQDDAVALATTLLDRFRKESDPTGLLEVANFLRGAGEETPTAYRPLILQATQAAVDLTKRQEVEPLLTYAEVELAFGSREKALAAAKEAQPLATDDGTRAIIRQAIAACQAKR